MDNSSFPWKLLRCVHDKNGGRAFEDIAYQYVEDHFVSVRILDKGWF